MDSDHDEELDIRGWHLYFDHSRRWVVITDNGIDETLHIKFTPAEIEYETLVYLMDLERRDKEIEWRIKYREDLL